MHQVNIKPLSANRLWYGKRFKTNDYIDYETELLWTLPKSGVTVYKKMKLDLEFGMSRATDIDNPIKGFVDTLEKQYNFNDNQIYELNVKKIPVKKGKEFIRFKIEKLD